MNTSALIQKVWNFCHTLKDDGVGYGDYLEQLTYLLFLKMAHEYTEPPYARDTQVPARFAWPALRALTGAPLEAQYLATLHQLGQQGGMLGAIFFKAQNKIQDPAKLSRLVQMIDAESWVGMDADTKGDLYEGLLQKNAEDTKSGAGQYFTPRAVIRADLKANPGKRSFGSPGNGSSPHLAAEMMKSMTSTFAVHVPYRGAAPALTDLLGGQLDFLFDPGIAIPHIKSGKLRLLAVGSPKRSPLFPDTPTLDEVGLKGFDADTVFGFYAPAGTPAAVVSRLNTEINRILGTPAMKDRIQAFGGVPAPMTPAEFQAKAADDSKRFGGIIRERKIVGD